MKKIGLVAALVFAAVFSLLAITEIYFQITFHENPSKAQWAPLDLKANKVFQNRLVERVLKEKDDEQSFYYRLPPLIFGNCAEPEVMEKAAQAALPHIPGQWKVNNPFLPPEQFESSAKTVTINSHGFRDPERGLAKGKATFRIVIYGDVTPLGLEVNDEETYPRVLEHLLNDGPNHRYHFEVWNGALRYPTSMVGLMRMKKEAPLLKPDLVIFDFGFTEGSLLNNHLFYDHNPRGLGNFKGPGAFERSAYDFCSTGLAAHLATCKFVGQHYGQITPEKALELVEVTLQQAVSYAIENKFSLLVVDHAINQYFTPDYYKRFNNPDLGIFALSANPPAPPKEEIEKFWSQSNWADEYHFSAQDKKKHDSFVYMGAPSRYNAQGHQLIAKDLETKIQALIESGQLKPAKSVQTTEKK